MDLDGHTRDGEGATAASVAEARGGCDRAWRDLVATYHGPLTRFLRTFFRNPDDVDEVAQTTFVRAFTRLGDLRDDARFGSWLWTIARSVALDAMRRSRREPEEPITTLPDDVEDLVSKAPGVEHWMAREAVVRRVREAVAALPEPAQRIVRLRYGDGLSYEEIARRMDLGAVQVKARLARARQRLRRGLESTAREWSELLDELP